MTGSLTTSSKFVSSGADFYGDVSVKGNGRMQFAGSVALEQQSLQSYWTFKYAQGIGADDIGMFFNLPTLSYDFMVSNSPVIKNYITGDVYFGGTIKASGNTLALGGDDTNSFIDLNTSTTRGRFLYTSSPNQFSMDQTLNMSTSKGITFGNLSAGIVDINNNSDLKFTVYDEFMFECDRVSGASFTIDFNVSGAFFYGNNGRLSWNPPNDYWEFADNLYTSGVFNSAVTKTGAYTLSSGDDVVFGSGTFTVTLPVSVNGRVFNVKNISTGNITLIGSGTQTVDTGSLVLSQHETVTVCGDGSNWWVI